MSCKKKAYELMKLNKSIDEYLFRVIFNLSV